MDSYCSYADCLALNELRHDRWTAMKKFDRITVDPAQMGGVPCVRHLRIPVATVLRLLASGLTEAAILSEYPDLQAGRYSRVLTLRRGFGDGAGTAPPECRLKFLDRKSVV